MGSIAAKKQAESIDLTAAVSMKPDLWNPARPRPGCDAAQLKGVRPSTLL
jgi:hypothetical protein